MTLSGWIFMVASLGAVTALAATCFRRILAAPAEPPGDDGDSDG